MSPSCDVCGKQTKILAKRGLLKCCKECSKHYDKDGNHKPAKPK